jgi:hypothetical protein
LKVICSNLGQGAMGKIQEFKEFKEFEEPVIAICPAYSSAE